jgi:hypothetical protein
MFQKLFVDKLHWCTYIVFTELLMLGQCMPGEAGRRRGRPRVDTLPPDQREAALPAMLSAA